MDRCSEGKATVEESLAAAQQTFDDFRACVIVHDAMSDEKEMQACLMEIDPVLAGLFGD